MSLRVQILSSPEELSRFAGEWEQLLSRSVSNQPALSPVWLLPWWQVFGAGSRRRLLSLVIRDGSRLIGFAPLLGRRYWYQPAIPYRRIELLGSGEDEQDEVFSEYLGVIAERGSEAAVAGAVAEALARGELGRWDELVCPRMNGAAPGTNALVRALSLRRIAVEQVPHTICHFIQLPGSWDDYLNALPQKRRYRLRRNLRDFEEWAGDTVKLHEATDAAELRAGIDILIRLHGDRWSSSGEDGAFSSSRFRRFHELVMPRLLERGALELLWLEAHGEPVAAVYNILWGDSVQFYQSGRKPDLPAKLAPGIALHAIAIQRAIAAGRKEYDFLGGDVRYKAEMSTDSRPLVYLRATRPAMLRERTRRAVRKNLMRARAVRDAIRQRLSPPETKPADVSTPPTPATGPADD